MKKKCDSLNECSNRQKKRRLWRARMNKHIENRANAKAYKLGKGRIQ